MSLKPTKAEYQIELEELIMLIPTINQKDKFIWSSLCTTILKHIEQVKHDGYDFIKQYETIAFGLLRRLTTQIPNEKMFELCPEALKLLEKIMNRRDMSIWLRDCISYFLINPKLFYYQQQQQEQDGGSNGITRRNYNEELIMSHVNDNIKQNDQIIKDSLIELISSSISKGYSLCFLDKSGNFILADTRSSQIFEKKAKCLLKSNLFDMMIPESKKILNTIHGNHLFSNDILMRKHKIIRYTIYSNLAYRRYRRYVKKITQKSNKILAKAADKKKLTRASVNNIELISQSKIEDFLKENPLHCEYASDDYSIYHKFLKCLTSLVIQIDLKLIKEDLKFLKNLNLSIDLDFQFELLMNEPKHKTCILILTKNSNFIQKLNYKDMRNDNTKIITLEKRIQQLFSEQKAISCLKKSMKTKGLKYKELYEDNQFYSNLYMNMDFYNHYDQTTKEENESKKSSLLSKFSTNDLSIRNLTKIDEKDIE